MTSLQVRGNTIEAAYDFVVQGHKVFEDLRTKNRTRAHGEVRNHLQGQGRRHGHLEDDPEE